MVNHSVAAAQPISPLLRERAHNELGEIDAVAQVHSQRYAVVALLQQKPVGVERLLTLSGPLPALA